MDDVFEPIAIMLGIVLTIIILRLLGSWMLRINEVIDNQKKLIDLLSTFNNNFVESFDEKAKERNAKEEISNNKDQ